MNRDRVVLITGAANGIDAERARATTERIARDGAAVVATAADVSHAEGARRVVERALTDFGRLDILVNNAAITRDAPLGAMYLHGYASRPASS